MVSSVLRITVRTLAVLGKSLRAFKHGELSMRKILILLSVVAIAAGAIWHFYERGKTVEPESKTAKEYYEEGCRLLNHGETEKALELSMEGAECFPNNPSLKYLVGICCHNAGDDAKARTFFRKALELNADFHMARVAYAASILKTEDNKEDAWAMANQELRKLPQKALEEPEVL